jgi:hypothetical protein
MLYRSEDGYDVEKYTELTLKSIEVLLEPLGYTFRKPESKRKSKKKSIPAPELWNTG